MGAAAGEGGATPPTVDPFAEYDNFETEVAENGRIGYSRFGRWSSIGLGALIIVGMLAVGVYQWLDGRNDSNDPGDVTVGADAVRPAPDFSLSLFDGGTFNLADQRGKVVVVNFWASWCIPCKEEMPELQSIAASPPENVVFVGVGARSDKEAEARAFAEKYGVTYAIGRDTVGGDELRGAIEQAYGIPGYPSTIVIDPNGNISAIKVGAVSEDELRTYIENARK